MTELNKFRPGDDMQEIYKTEFDYQFIMTASHGYLVVPTGDVNESIARSIVKYGYIGKHAIYLEEDCEYNEFKQAIEGA